MGGHREIIADLAWHKLDHIIPEPRSVYEKFLYKYEKIANPATKL
jgi:hypothetical protein